MFVAPGYVITVRHGPPASPAARDAARASPAALKSGPAAVVWGDPRRGRRRLHAGRRGDRDARSSGRADVFAGRDGPTERIYELKQEVNDLYRAVHPLLAPLDAMSAGGVRQIDPGLLRYFRDVNDHLRLIHEEILAQRDQLKSALDANVALVSVRQNEISARQNEIVKQLTIVATVFLPLSFVIGFFGQNFGWMVEHIYSLGDFVVFGVGALALSVAALYAWFRRGGFV